MRASSIRTWVAAVVVMAAAAAAGQGSPVRAAGLPYAAVHDPQFVAPAEATFLHDDDRVIGVAAGRMVKAYPAAILSQHGLVEDRSPDGPIAVTW